METQIYVRANHGGLVKFQTSYDDAYDEAKTALQRLAASAPRVVAERFGLRECAPVWKIEVIPRVESDEYLLSGEDTAPKNQDRLVFVDVPATFPAHRQVAQAGYLESIEEMLEQDASGLSEVIADEPK